MACFIICCRLASPGSDYVAVTDGIERLGKSWECPGSSWIVSTDLGAAEIRDSLRPHLGPHDELVVARISGEVAWGGAGRGFGEGLRAVLG